MQSLNPMHLPAQAAYHGVPLVTMPGHVIDQADNAVKAARLGFGIPIYVDGNFSAAALAAGLTRVLTEPQFRANAARVAAKMRARRRTPAEESVGAHRAPVGFQTGLAKARMSTQPLQTGCNMWQPFAAAALPAHAWQASEDCIWT